MCLLHSSARAAASRGIAPARRCAAILAGVLAGALATSWPAPLRAQVASGARVAAPLRWSGRVAPGDLLVIDVVRGRVRLEAAAGTEVEVLVTRTAATSDPATVRLRVDTSATSLRLLDQYPPSPAGGRYAARRECLPTDDDRRGDFWHSDVRLDVVARVPAGTRVSARVMAGAVEVAPGLGAAGRRESSAGSGEWTTITGSQAPTHERGQ